MKKTGKKSGVALYLSAAIAVLSPSAGAREPYPPNLDRNFLTNVYWGDTHVHTKLSSDSFICGTRLAPAAAYRFAKGEAVVTDSGMVARLRRPLDFLVVADHAENLGVLASIDEGNADLPDSARDALGMLQQFREEIETFRRRIAEEMRGKIPSEKPDMGRIADTLKKGDLIRDKAFKRSIWEQVTATADQFNDPGRFTAFIGYEWSSSGGTQLGNLHRVIVFKDGAERANASTPFSAYDSKDPQQLWAHLARYEQATGGEVLAIPHNANLSNGEMFPTELFGEQLSREYVEARSRWEPLYEVVQTKGTSEAHPVLSPNDEFADFEIWNSWDGRLLPAGRDWNEDEKRRKQGEYARSALKRGLDLQARTGVNPFKFGLIGSTDSHTSLASADENNFWGKFLINTPSTTRLRSDVGMAMTTSLDQQWVRALGRESSLPGPSASVLSAAGYAAVWAVENTREALFAAMKRRETYATTGPRITVRFFGGWDYVQKDALRPDLPLIGYRKGVPMGGDIASAPAGRAPRFLIHAVKDPDGANLDRVQVVKGWRDENGGLHERIYDVVLSGERSGTRKAPPVGNTVDVKSATYTNSIGTAELATVWTDPKFNPREMAFYYVRVLEIPTPRWTTYDGAYFKVDLPKDVPTTIQERAYTSPIWYTP